MPVNPPLLDGAIMHAESSLADTIVPVEPPLVNDEMVPAGEFTLSRERGLAGFLRVNPIFEHLGGPLYRCKAKWIRRVPDGLESIREPRQPKQLGPCKSS